MRADSLLETAGLILAFDTSAAQCAAALVRGEQVLAERQEPMARGQAERLLPLLEELLAEAGVAWPDLDALAVCTGPGNFTGLRIAVAVARGLALALDRPAVGITRFEALAWGHPGPVEVALEDGRGALFRQRFTDGLPDGPPGEAEPGPAPAALLCLGQRAGARAETLGCRAGSEAETVGPAALARLLAARGTAGAVSPAPLYLRRADAAPSSEAPTRILDDA